MTPKDLADFFALLSILEPDTITCKLAARLATAGTATDGETDTAVIKELREHAEAIQDYPELARHDPFDRLLVAQADRAGLRLLTADRVLLGLQRSFILDATK